MNFIFTAVLMLSIAMLAVVSPESALSSMLAGAERTLAVCASLFAIYAVWCGLSRVAEKSGLSAGMAKALMPLTGKIFASQNKNALEYTSMNLACNLLGLGGASTPYAVKAVRAFEEDGNFFAQSLLFVINATSVQIVPATVIALRAGAGSASPSDIFLPSLVCTVFSTAFAVGLFILWTKLKKFKGRKRFKKSKG